MQNSNYAIKQLKKNVLNKVQPTLWKLNAIKQFKRNFNQLNVVSDVLVKGTSLSDPIVVTFPFLVEILAGVHQRLSHIGRHKLMHIVKQYFYHPALEKVARDLCRSCKHCQLFKTNNQPVAPPILKIVSLSV